MTAVKINAKVITLTNRNRGKQHDELVRIRTKIITFNLCEARGKWCVQGFFTRLFSQSLCIAITTT